MDIYGLYCCRGTVLNMTNILPPTLTAEFNQLYVNSHRIAVNRPQLFLQNLLDTNNFLRENFSLALIYSFG